MAILPGSRTQELTRNLPIMIRAAAKLARQRPATRFAVACLHERHKALAEQIIKENARGSGGSVRHRIEVYAARTPELIRLADMAWAVSGSVSLELMMEALPTVILYKLNRFDLWIARPFIKAKYITLVNLLADAELMPEYLTEHDVSDELVSWARTWLDDPIARARATANLAALRHRVAQPGASHRAAERIVAWLREHSHTDRERDLLPRPPRPCPGFHSWVGVFSLLRDLRRLPWFDTFNSNLNHQVVARVDTGVPSDYCYLWIRRPRRAPQPQVLGHRPDFLKQPLKLGKSSDWAPSPAPGGVRMHLHQQPIRAGGEGGLGHWRYSSRLPVPWLGSTSIGKWESCFAGGMTDRSSVLRV